MDTSLSIYPPVEPRALVEIYIYIYIYIYMGIFFLKVPHLGKLQKPFERLSFRKITLKRFIFHF